MGKPFPCLAPVDAERLEPRLEVAGERRRAASLVLEDEHPDAPRLAVPHGHEPRRLGDAAGRGAERLDDPGQFACRPVAEERERDVEMLARDDTDVGGEVLPLPGGERVERRVGQPQRAEEP